MCRNLLASMQSDKSSHPLHLLICRNIYTLLAIKYIYLKDSASQTNTMAESQLPEAFDISCQLSQRPCRKQCPPLRVECDASVGASDGGLDLSAQTRPTASMATDGNGKNPSRSRRMSRELTRFKE